MELLQQLDLSILLFIQEHLRVAWMNGFWDFITHFGDGGVFWILLTLALLILKKTRKVGIVAACSLLLGFLITNVTLKPLVDRVRPYHYSDAIIPLGRIPSEASFPSGHTSASFSCALICPIELFKSPRISLSERMLPLESYTSSPSFLKSLEAESVGF